MINKHMKWKEYIKQQLESSKLITLGTLNENITWSSPTYFSYDEDISLYILLDTITQHMKNLIFLPKASVTIDSRKDDEYRVQMVGDVEILTKESSSKIKDIVNQLIAFHTTDIKELNESTSLDWRIIKFTPRNLFVVNKDNMLHKEEISFNQPVSLFTIN